MVSKEAMENARRLPTGERIYGYMMGFPEELDRQIKVTGFAAIPGKGKKFSNPRPLTMDEAERYRRQLVDFKAATGEWSGWQKMLGGFSSTWVRTAEGFVPIAHGPLVDVALTDEHGEKYLGQVEVIGPNYNCYDNNGVTAYMAGKGAEKITVTYSRPGEHVFAVRWFNGKDDLHKRSVRYVGLLLTCSNNDFQKKVLSQEWGRAAQMALQAYMNLFLV